MSFDQFLEEREEVLEMAQQTAANPVNEAPRESLEPLLDKVLERLERIEQKLDSLALQNSARSVK